MATSAKCSPATSSFSLASDSSTSCGSLVPLSAFALAPPGVGHKIASRSSSHSSPQSDPRALALERILVVGVAVAVRASASPTAKLFPRFREVPRHLRSSVARDVAHLFRPRVRAKHERVRAPGVADVVDEIVPKSTKHHRAHGGRAVGRANRRHLHEPTRRVRAVALERRRHRRAPGWEGRRHLNDE